jgi:hypothetical protein
VSADLANVATAWANVLTATNVPKNFDVEDLSDFVDDAIKTTLPVVQASLKESDACE